MNSRVIDKIRISATQELNQAKRAEFGQYLTPGVIATFMAGMFEANKSVSVQLLDAGAGVGTLTAAFLDRRLTKMDSFKNLQVTAYEIDSILLPHLRKNILTYKDLLAKVHVGFELNVTNRDFIEDAVFKIEANDTKLFSHAILNPPYKKINSASSHRHLLSSVGIETVNLYSGFVALSLALLKDKGELVAIIPRSFCNGNYYKPFREFILKHTAIKQIHLFESRTEAFKDDGVLQENVIIHLIKEGTQGDVIISKSTNESLHDLVEEDYLFNQIVKPNDLEVFIHIPSVQKSQLDNSTTIIHTLQDIGLEVSTGPVVDFRVKEHLFMEPIDGSIPLLYSNHFNGKELNWPVKSKKPNAIELTPETRKMFYPTGFYTLVRRFSSKEEKQRIVARVLNPKLIHSDFIGIENHLNVFHSKKSGIPEDLAYGLAAYLNSSIVDFHFRSFSGHTQVNATDLKQMKYPNRNELMKLGRWSKKMKSFDQKEIDMQLMKII